MRKAQRVGDPRIKIMLMRNSKGQRISGWSVLKFKNMLMRISERQKKNDKIYRSENFLSGVLMKCENRGGWAIQGFKIMLNELF